MVCDSWVCGSGDGPRASLAYLPSVTTWQDRLGQDEAGLLITRKREKRMNSSLPRKRVFIMLLVQLEVFVGEASGNEIHISQSSS